MKTAIFFKKKKKDNSKDCRRKIPENENQAQKRHSQR